MIIILEPVLACIIAQINKNSGQRNKGGILWNQLPAEIKEQ